MTTVAGVDVGGSGIRAQVSHGHELSSAQLSAALPRIEGMVDIHHLASLVAESVGTASAGVGARTPQVICVGMTGLPDIVTDPSLLAQKIGVATGAHTVILGADAATAHIGALRLAPGTVVAAGTGVVALGTDFKHVWDRSDGWGYLLGDEGGGAWIGQQGLIAAFRASDHRANGSDRLRELMHDHLGAEERVVTDVYGNAVPAYLLGRFAPHVAQAARDGDAVAAQIWRMAGQALGTAALAASSRLEPTFSWAGHLFRAGDLLLDPYQETILNARPDAVFVAPTGSPADGALLLAKDHLRQPRTFAAPWITAYEVNQA